MVIITKKHGQVDFKALTGLVYDPNACCLRYNRIFLSKVKTKKKLLEVFE